MVGVVSYYAGSLEINENEATVVPGGGWLVCNGARVSRSQYPRLFNVIKTMYGSIDSETFNLPNLIGNYIKGDTQSAKSGESRVGKHKHAFDTNTTEGGLHTHTKGTMNITGGFQGSGQFKKPKTHGNTDPGNATPYGAFKCVNRRYKVGNAGAEADWYYAFNAEDSWVGETSEDGQHSHAINGYTANNTFIENNREFEAPEENEVKHITLIPIIKY
jgi:microcystin-dependent protein